MDDRTRPVSRPGDGHTPYGTGEPVPEGRPASGSAAETVQVGRPFVTPAQGPYPPGPYPPGPYPPGQGSGAGATPPAASGPPRRRRRTLVVLAAVLAVLALVVAAVVVFLLPPSPDDAVAEVSGDVRGWEGVTYRGAVDQPGVGPVNVEITTNTGGDRSGTLTRPDGGRASFAEVGGVPLVNGDMSWWSPEPLGAGKSQRLSGFWVRVPAAETSWLRPAGLLPPAALADDLTGAGAPAPEYTEPGGQPVDGVDGRAIEWPGTASSSPTNGHRACSRSSRRDRPTRPVCG